MGPTDDLIRFWRFRSRSQQVIEVAKPSTSTLLVYCLCALVALPSENTGPPINFCELGK